MSCRPWTIGIIHLGNLGDNLALSIITAAVRRRFINSHITVIVNNYPESFRDNPSIDEVIRIDLCVYDSWLKSNKKNYDLFLESHYTLRWDYSEKVLTNPQIQEFKLQADKRFKSYKTLFDKFHSDIPELDKLGKSYWELALDSGNLEGSPDDMFFSVRDEDYTTTKKFEGLHYVVLNDSAGSGKRQTKNWQPGNWIPVVSYIKKLGLIPIQVGEANNLPIDGCERFLGSLFETAALIKGAEFCILPETGLAYIARAVGTRSIVMFGPSPVKMFGYPENINLRSKVCIRQFCWWRSPDWYRRCQALDYKVSDTWAPPCMSSISPEQVIRAINKLLTERGWSMDYREPSSEMDLSSLRSSLFHKEQEVLRRSLGTPTEPFERAAAQERLDEQPYKNLIQAKRITRILDEVGTGQKVLVLEDNGQISRLLKLRGNEVSLTNSSQIRALRAKYLLGLEVTHCLIEALPFKNQSFDRVVVLEALGNSWSLSKCLAEAERVCTPKGKLILTVPQPEFSQLNTLEVPEQEDRSTVLSISKTNPKAEVPKELETLSLGLAKQFKTKVIHTLAEFNKKGEDLLVIRSFQGLGDSICQRAFIRELDFPVYLDTPWPQIYSDLKNVILVPCETKLRTQNKNLARQPQLNPNLLTDKPVVELSVRYGTEHLVNDSILGRLSKIFGTKPKTVDLPDFPWPEKVPHRSKVAIIRPATLRKEWPAPARNPDPKYLKQASKLLRAAGYYVVSVADLVPGEEWLVGPEPVADLKLHHGELSVEDLLGLCQGAEVLCGGHGFLTYIALAYKKPMLVIAGGYGGDNSPQQVADPNYVDTSCLTWMIPDCYCKCNNMAHQKCDKRISKFKPRAKQWISNLGHKAKYSLLYDGGLGDVFIRMMEGNVYASLAELEPGEYCDIHLVSHNPSATEWWAWHPKRSQLNIIEYPWREVKHNSEIRQISNIPLEVYPPLTDKPPEIYPSSQDKKLVDSLVKPYVVISAVAGATYRNIPPEALKLIVQGVQAKGYDVVAIGKNYRRPDGTHGEENVYNFNTNVVSMIDRLSAPGTAYLISKAKAFISCHSSFCLVNWYLYRKPNIVFYPKGYQVEHCYNFGVDFPETYQVFGSEFDPKLLDLIL